MPRKEMSESAFAQKHPVYGKTSISSNPLDHEGFINWAQVQPIRDMSE
jgi:hypothetical protein